MYFKKMTKNTLKKSKLHSLGCVSQKQLKSTKTEKTRFKKVQVKNSTFTRKTTVKGQKRGPKGVCLENHSKRGFWRVRKTAFFRKHIRIKGKSKKGVIFSSQKLKKVLKKTGVCEGKKL